MIYPKSYIPDNITNIIHQAKIGVFDTCEYSDHSVQEPSLIFSRITKPSTWGSPGPAGRW